MVTLSDQAKKKATIFPDFPRGSPVVGKEGNLTPVWHLQLSSLFQALQKNFKNEGIQIPQLETSELDKIKALYTPYIGKTLPKGLPDISGQMVFDKTNTARVPKIFVITYNTNGTLATASWKTFTIT